jgi:hypothetical protein
MVVGDYLQKLAAVGREIEAIKVAGIPIDSN